jgi:oligopeptidase A
MSELSTKFSNNVLDATKAFSHTCVEKSEVEGLPDSALEQAAQTASQKGGHENATAADGPWMFTLDAPSYMAVRSHSKNRTLREKGKNFFFISVMDNVIDVVFCVQCTARTSREPRNTSHPSWMMPR